MALGYGLPDSIVGVSKTLPKKAKAHLTLVEIAWIDEAATIAATQAMLVDNCSSFSFEEVRSSLWTKIRTEYLEWKQGLLNRLGISNEALGKVVDIPPPLPRYSWQK